MRTDGRAWNELRPCKINLDFVPWALGSVLLSFGNTTVLCNVSMKDGVPTHCRSENQGWITAEYAMLPHAGTTRSSRDGRPSVDGRTFEIQRLISRSIRAGIDLNKLGPRTIQIDCDVLKADGGTRTSAITGAWIALRIALQKLYPEGYPPGLLRFPWIAAVSAGIVNGTAFLDLCYQEDSMAEIDLNLVGAPGQHWIEIQGTAESGPRDRDRFLSLVALAENGLEALFSIQEHALEQGDCLKK